MPESRLKLSRWALIVGLAFLTFGVGLGKSGRLTYHEAFVAESAREMTARGDWVVPTIGGHPWLEKPPLAFWMVALAGQVSGGITEGVARFPSAVAALLLVVGITTFATRRFGQGVGLLAGLIQATTAWTIMRGRLAEVDVLLACLITWAIVAFDRMRARKQDSFRSPPPLWGRVRVGGTRMGLRACGGLRVPRSDVVTEPPLAPPSQGGERTENARLWQRAGVVTESPLTPPSQGGERTENARLRSDVVTEPPLTPPSQGGERTENARLWSDVVTDPPLVPFSQGGERADLWRWVFFAALGLSALAKGVGFGAVLIGSVVVVVTLWDRDSLALRRFWFGRGWALAAVLGLSWPVLIALRHPSAVGLWALHVTDRFAAKPAYFIGTPWWQFLGVVLGQLLPWTPLALVGAFRSLPRTLAERGGGDRLLWAWLVVPLLLLSMATVKSPHYAIHALPPCSIWAALGLVRLGQRLQQRGWSAERVRRFAGATFAGLGIVCAVGYSTLGPLFDRRGVEWGFYQTASRLLATNEPLALLYNVPDWDREPYPSPFGPVPHDLAVRLYYLERPAYWRFGAAELAKEPPAQGTPFAVIGRDCDLPALRRLGHVDTLAQSLSLRRDRTYRLFRVTPAEEGNVSTEKHRLTQIGGKWEK